MLNRVPSCGLSLTLDFKRRTALFLTPAVLLDIFLVAEALWALPRQTLPPRYTWAFTPCVLIFIHDLGCYPRYEDINIAQPPPAPMAPPEVRSACLPQRGLGICRNQCRWQQQEQLLLAAAAEAAGRTAADCFVDVRL